MDHLAFVSVSQDPATQRWDVKVDNRHQISFYAFSDAQEWAFAWCDRHDELNPFLTINRKGAI